MTFNGIVQLCQERLPGDYRNCPWTYPGLDRGRALLTNDGQASAYISAYGEAHRKKLEQAFENFPFETF